MLLQAGASDQQVINVYETEVKATEDSVHKVLERLGCIPEYKQYPEKLKESEWSHDCCLKNVCRLNRDLVICLHQIDLRKDGGTVE